MPVRDTPGEDLMALGAGILALRVIIHRTDISDRRPLVILNSVDYPMPPSEDFCDRKWAEGYQVIFVERPGFGRSRGLPDEQLLQVDGGERLELGTFVVRTRARVHTAFR